MTRPLLDAWRNVAKPVIGMLHLPALPGAPRHTGDLSGLRRYVLRDARTLVEAGVHGLMLENFGDAPFFPGRVPAETLAHMTVLAAEVRRAFPAVPLGVNVLRSDGLSAMAIAHAVGASFIRVNILCGARVTDQGVIQGIAHELLRYRASLGAGTAEDRRGTRSVRIFADVNVKHSAPLAARALAQEVADTVERGLADALIVTGGATGMAASLADVEAVKQAAGATPVLVGSGVTPETIAEYARLADGFIIGSAFQRGGVGGQPVEPRRVRRMLEKVSG